MKEHIFVHLNTCLNLLRESLGSGNYHVCCQDRMVFSIRFCLVLKSTLFPGVYMSLYQKTESCPQGRYQSH